MYREGLLVLAIILIVIGAIMEYVGSVSVSVIGTLGWIMVIVGIIAFVVWLVLIVVDYIKTGK